MHLIQDIQKYIGKDNLIHNKTKNGMGIVSENGALFTVEYIITLLKQKDIEDDVKKQEIEKAKLSLASLEKFPGITIRSTAWDSRYDSMDNMSALLVFSALYDGSQFAKRMKKAGEEIECVGFDNIAKLPENRLYYYDDNKRLYLLAKIVSTVQGASFFKPKYYWNNRYPQLFCVPGWFGRSFGFLGLMDIAATGKTTLFRNFSLFIGQIIGVFKSKMDLDSKTLAYVAWQLLKDRNILWRLSYMLWYWKLKKDYPKGMKEVYSMYFGEAHPIAKYTNE